MIEKVSLQAVYEIMDGEKTKRQTRTYALALSASDDGIRELANAIDSLTQISMKPKRNEVKAMA